MVMYVPPVPAVYKGAEGDTELYHARVYDDKIAGTQFPNLIPDHEHQI